MRYTRYDYKRKKSNNFLGFIVLVIILSIGIGFGVFKIFFSGDNTLINGDGKVPTVTEPDNLNGGSKETNATMKDEKTFIAIQCGVFSTKEKADIAVSGLPTGYSGFVIEDTGKFKVMAGLFSEEDGNKKSEELTTAGIENYKAKLVVPIKNIDNQVKVEIIEACLTINSTLSNSDVKSVKTADLKVWVKEVEEKQKITDNEVKEFIEKINNLPEEVTKSSMQEYTIYMYN